VLSYVESKSSTVPAALHIRHDNITLQGAGKGLTKLNFELWDGRSPDKWDVVNGKLVRGCGIYVHGTDDAKAPRRNFRMLDLELCGNGRNTGNQNWPADPTTGDGWDITHKGVVYDFDKHLDGLTIERCHLHNWWGEIVYGGGQNIRAASLIDCDVHTTNGDCWSVSGDNEVRGNVLHGAVHSAIEDHIFRFASYTGNEIYDIDHEGIALLTAPNPSGRVTIQGNNIHDCPKFAVRMINAAKVDCLNNVATNCASDNTNPAAFEVQANAVGKVCSDVVVAGNTVQTTKGATRHAFRSLGSDAGSLKSLTFSGNVADANGGQIDRGSTYDTVNSDAGCLYEAVPVT
jgi:hypothetical protein